MGKWSRFCGPRSQTTVGDTPAEVVAETLDSVLKERLRAVLDSRPVTEAQLRKLFEEGRACALILSGQLDKADFLPLLGN